MQSEENSFLKLTENEIPLCIGVDPNFEKYLKWSPFLESLFHEKGRISATEIVSKTLLEEGFKFGIKRCKFQSAYFEQMGFQGVELVTQLAKYAKQKGIHVLMDVKRGDISSTMEAYGEAFFKDESVDAITVTAYMGTDVVEALRPFLEQGKGIYVVLISSNPSGIEFAGQKLENGKTVAEFLMTSIENKMGVLSENIGYVVGATILDRVENRLFDKLMAKHLLLPGFGAQGATFSPRVNILLEKPEASAVFPISRGASLFGLNNMKGALANMSSIEDYQSLVGTCLEEYRGYFAST